MFYVGTYRWRVAIQPTTDHTHTFVHLDHSLENYETLVKFRCKTRLLKLLAELNCLTALQIIQK